MQLLLLNCCQGKIYLSLMSLYQVKVGFKVFNVIEVRSLSIGTLSIQIELKGVPIPSERTLVDYFFNAA